MSLVEELRRKGAIGFVADRVGARGPVVSKLRDIRDRVRDRVREIIRRR